MRRMRDSRRPRGGDSQFLVGAWSSDHGTAGKHILRRPCWRCFIIDSIANSRLEYVSEEKTKSLERRRSEAASFTRQSEAILDRHSETAAPHARLGGSESTDAAGALPVHPAPARLELSTAATG
jgi:hypothetical protein